MKTTNKLGPRTKRLYEQRIREAAESHQRLLIDAICLQEHICAVVLENGAVMQIPNQWVTPQIH